MRSTMLLSAHYACDALQRKGYEPPGHQQLFSFNSPAGMCPECDGLGKRFSFDLALLVPDPSISFYNGALPIVGPMRGMGRAGTSIFIKALPIRSASILSSRWNDLPNRQRDWLLNGAGDRHITL